MGAGEGPGGGGQRREEAAAAQPPRSAGSASALLLVSPLRNRRARARGAERRGKGV